MAILEAKFAYDGGGTAKGGNVTLCYDSVQVETGRVQATQALIFSADQTTEEGRETGAPVSANDTNQESNFNGKINRVQIHLGDDNNDHFIEPEERLRVAMARQ